MTLPPTRPLLIWLALASGVAGCKRDREEAGGAAATQAVVAAETIVLTPQSFAESVDGIGTVVPRTGEFAALGVPVAARIARVLVATGQRVQRGDALIELDRTTIDADAKSADATLRAAEAAATRATRLVDAGVMPRKEAEQALAEQAKARAAVATARRTADLATLRAPLSGVVTRLAATVGALADPNLPLIEIANPTAVDVVLSTTAPEAARIHPGMLVSFRAGPDTVGTGTVAEVGGTVDSLSRGVTVRVRVGSTTRALRLGETIGGRVVLGVETNSIVVPIAALVPTGEGFRVFVVDSASVAHARPVTVAGKDDSRAHITAGLAVGERVVTSGAYAMDEGAKVAPKATRP